jgi:hypothetical protein
MRVNTGFKAPRYLYELRYQYTDDRGQRREGAHRTYAPLNSLSFKQGQAVTVLFDRANPARSMAVDVLESEPITESHR